MEKVSSERNYGIEWLRILSMLMVVIIHINGSGGVIENSSGTNFWLLSNILHALCVIAVNLFALISGYLYFNKKIKLKNIFNLWLEVFFYSVGIAIIFYLLKLETFSWKSFLGYCLPITSGKYWYFTAYFYLFLLMPLLNIVINKTPKKFLIVITAIILIAFTTYSRINVHFSAVDRLSIESGFSTVWLATLYLVGAIIAKYNIGVKFKNQEVKPYFYLLFFLFSVGLSLLFGFVASKINGRPLIVVESYNSIFNAISSMFFFMFFVRKKFKPNKIISFLSKMSFGVYLIHENRIVRAHCVLNRFGFVFNYHPFVSLLILIGCAIAIYLACSIVEFLRQMLFKVCRVNKATDWADKKLCAFYDKIKIEDSVAPNFVKEDNMENANSEEPIKEESFTKEQGLENNDKGENL